MSNKSGVYVITCKATGEKYIGSSGDIPRRIKEHKYDLRNGIHDNYKLLAEWERYGEQQFESSILEEVEDSNSIFEREQYWLDELKPELNIATNARRSGCGVKRRQSTLDALSIARKKYLKKLTPARREAIRQKVIEGRKEWWESLSDAEREEHIRKISNPHTAATKKLLSQRTKAAYASGKLTPRHETHTPETRAKLRAAALKQFAGREEIRKQKRAEWELGREEREMARRVKMSQSQKGKKIPEATKKKLRIAAVAQWQDPAYRAKHQAAVQAVMKDPGVLKRLSDAHKGKKLSKAQRDKIGKAHKGRKNAPETIEKMREARRLWWKNKPR